MKRATFKLRRSANRKAGGLGWKAASPDALNRLITMAAIADRDRSIVTKAS
jgi:hypothetical protein